MSQAEALFVHVPKFENHYLPLGDFMNITYMPMGVFALARLLNDHGHPSEIIHLGVEWLHDPKYSIVREVESSPNLRSVGLPLYWHYQSYDVIQIVRRIKAARPDIFVYLGGVTAAYFRDEIMREIPEVDGIISGHGETPVLALAEQLRGARDLARVPNLMWRSPTGAILNEGHYYARDIDLDQLIFADLPLLRHHATYVDLFGFPLAFSKETSVDDNKRHQRMGHSFFPLFIGRGCPVVCTYCGGNRDTLRRVNGGSNMLWRSPQAVATDIELALAAGYHTMALCFDPVPENDAYYVELFRLLRERRTRANFYFECWGLPTERFMREFTRTFPSGDSYFALSPDSGDETVRRLNKGHFYSNADLLAVCDRLRVHGISMDIFFTIGLPGENLAAARRTRDLIALMAQRYPNIRRLMTWSVQLEPGSPQFERPQDFNMQTDRKNFMDFFRVHGGDGGDTYSSLGFKINGYFGDERDQGGIHDFARDLQLLKCLEFCFLSPDPRRYVAPAEGRAHCLERRQNLARNRGEEPPTEPLGPQHDYFAEVTRLRRLRGHPARAEFA